MDNEQDFLNGLRFLIEASGEKPAPLSRRAGMGETAIRDFFRKGSVPKVSNAKSIADALGVTVDDIFNAARGISPPRPDDSNYGDSFLAIPRYDARLSAGAGSFNSQESEILDYIPFTKDFLRRKLGRNSVDGLVCCDVRGESMEPTLTDGDLLVVDLRLTEQPAGIYAINFDGESFVKRVEKTGEGYSLVSDNRAYPPIVIKGHDLDVLNIIGKVVWAAKTDFRSR